MTDNSGLLTRFDISERHRQFIELYAECGDPGHAAVECGYTREHGWQMLRMPIVGAAMHAYLGQKIRVEGASVGFRVLVTIAKDDKAPPGVRAKCAIALLDRAGHTPPRPEAQKADETDLAAMSQVELLAVINQAESELAARAKPIGAPVAAPMNNQTIDIFE